MSLSATPNVAARHSSHAQLMTVIYMYFFLELPERIVVCVRYHAEYWKQAVVIMLTFTRSPLGKSLRALCCY